MTDFQALYTAVLEGNAPTAKATVQAALDEGADPEQDRKSVV